jgi:PHD/YefM family antitoxin component YafN of YafNO toxin-antitoxin module
LKHITASTALIDFDGILDNVIEFGEIVSIATEKGTAILINQEEWSGLQETLYLQSIPGMVDSIREADAESYEDGIDASEVDFGV